MRLLLVHSLMVLLVWLVCQKGIFADYQPWTEAKDPMALLWKKIVDGEVKLDATSEKSFLESLLRELDIPIESQVLVFSKTSLQNSLISPSRPRAIYYNEECYIGWVRDGAVEIIAMDPEKGAQFYILDPPQHTKSGKPQLLPSEQCLSCHEGTRTGRTKGVLVRSVYADDKGQPLLKYGSYVTGPESPLSQRWGGWYVTGTHGRDHHMGNVMASESGGAVLLPQEKGANITNLKDFISTEGYLTDTSDIISLMVLEHQCVVHNAMNAAAHTATEAMWRQRSLQDAFGEPVTEEPQGSALSIMKNQALIVVKQLLFVDEYQLQDDGVEGAESFQNSFRRNRKESVEGRSLKDFQLRRRLFKYRCSYMVYSKTFDAMPKALKREIYVLLHQVLTGENKAEDFAHLSESERGHILQILMETKPEMKEVVESIQTPAKP